MLFDPQRARGAPEPRRRALPRHKRAGRGQGQAALPGRSHQAPTPQGGALVTSSRGPASGVGFPGRASVHAPGRPGASRGGHRGQDQPCEVACPIAAQGLECQTPRSDAVAPQQRFFRLHGDQSGGIGWVERGHWPTSLSRACRSDEVRETSPVPPNSWRAGTRSDRRIPPCGRERLWHGGEKGQWLTEWVGIGIIVPDPSRYGTGR